MRAPNRIDIGAILNILPWDSNYFGFPVARIARTELDDATVFDALKTARARSIQLVYWAASPGRSVAQEILAEFGGALVDQKATFARELEQEVPGMPVSGSAFFEVVEHPKGPANPQLLELGVSAGQHSRFKIDSRITPEQHRGLYESWMRRSTLREMADAVFVAVAQETPAEPLGVITVSQAGKLGRIGLIAVHDSARRQGVGARLMEAAHTWMRTAGARRAEVVTQLANQGACRLYRACGYQLRELVDYYHFWPVAACAG